MPNLADLIKLKAIVPKSDSGLDGAQDISGIGRLEPTSVENGAILCNRCLRFDIQLFAGSASRRCGYLLREVEIAAANGCEFCSLLLDSVSDVEKPTYFNSTILDRNIPTNHDLYVHLTLSENYRNRGNRPVSLGLQVNRLLTELGDRFSDMRNASGHELCLAADLESPAARHNDIIGQYLGPNPDSEERITTVRNWIKDCSAHPMCNQTVSGSSIIVADQSPLPTRCIEISKGLKKVYLRETKGMQGCYITLTHRWNDDTGNSRTTVTNYRDRLDGRGFGPLPKLFQDVFIIAEKLDVKYVWIDSICIIQHGDNYADWRKEAPKMAQYYQFSILTIGGTMRNIKNGILNPYPNDATPWASKLVRLPYRDKSNAHAGFFYVYRRKERLLDQYLASVRDCHLFQRGWILQEWLLSKRFLWYTPTGLFFECHTDNPRTDLHERIVLENINKDILSALQLKASFNSTNPSILDFWYHALELYSGCELTEYNKDRILAIAGLAKEVGRILMTSKQDIPLEMVVQNEMYLSGLWLSDIHYGLLWEEDHASEHQTIEVTNTPSWSWSSLMTKVKWPERDQGAKGAFRVTGVCLHRLRLEKHERPEYMVVGKRVSGPLEDTSPDNVIGGTQNLLLDLTNMFACIHLRGKLLTVHVRGYLQTKMNLYTAAFSTAYGVTPKACQWRAICSPHRPEIIAGWGSLEQLPTEGTSCADYGVAVHALHVSTRYVRTGVLIKRAEPVLDVLFLKEIDGSNHVYGRLGVGRIADGNLIKEFHKSKDQAIQLI